MYLHVLMSAVLRITMFQTEIVDKIKTRLLYSIFFFENRALCETKWKKYCEAGQTTNDNMADARYIPDN